MVAPSRAGEFDRFANYLLDIDRFDLDFTNFALAVQLAHSFDDAGNVQG